MKKIIAALVAMMMFVPAFALADDAAPAATEVPAVSEQAEDDDGMAIAISTDLDWYELSNDSTVLTVRMPALADEDEGYEWSFEIWDSTIELLTSETTTDDEGNALWVASFRSTATAEADTGICLKYAKGDAFPMVDIDMFVKLSADGKIEVSDVALEDNTWLYVDEDGKTLYAALYANPTNGYEWSWISDPADALNSVLDEYVANETPEGVDDMDGMWYAGFQAAEGKSGDVVLTFNYTQSGSETPSESNIVNLTVAEDGTITINSVYGIAPLDAAE